MFESTPSSAPVAAIAVAAESADPNRAWLLAPATLDPGSDLLGQVRGLRARLAAPPRDLPDAERVDLIRALEELKNAACGAQARLSVDLDASQRAAQAAAGLPARLQGRGVAGQIGLARRESAHRGARYLGLAKVLVGEMPHTAAAMSAGWLSEWRATLLAKETACLSAEHRAAVDQALVGERAGEVEKWSDRRLEAEARKLAYRLDPESVVARIRNAVKDRCVTSRPAPDTMAYLSALLPAAKAVACYAALGKTADAARAAGDSRTRGQVMADTLVELVTGTKTADGLPVEIGLVVTDRALFANLGNQPAGEDGKLGADDEADDDETADADEQGDEQGDEQADEQADGQGTPLGDPWEEPGYLDGYGTVPASWIRDLIAGLPEHTRAWIRRLYANPRTGELVAMDSRRRLFKGSIRKFIVTRDRICRTPWCGAPIRHTDHPQSHGQGGKTSRRNSQGLCEACNYAKQAPGWAAHPVPGPVHTIRTVTPTGHVYESTAPPLPGWQPPPGVPVDPLDADDGESWFDHYLDDVDPPMPDAA